MHTETIKFHCTTEISMATIARAYIEIHGLAPTVAYVHVHERSVQAAADHFLCTVVTRTHPHTPQQWFHCMFLCTHACLQVYLGWQVGPLVCCYLEVKILHRKLILVIASSL